MSPLRPPRILAHADWSAGLAGRALELAERQSEIALDALIGLLLVLCGQRPSATPIDPAVQFFEGWMLGLDPTPLSG